MLTSSATRTGLCHGSTTTIVPRSTFSVIPAMYVRYCSGLVTIVYGVKWCSIVHTESKPGLVGDAGDLELLAGRPPVGLRGPAATDSPRSSAS